MREHNLWTIFDRVSREVPDRECLTWRDRTTTFEALADRSRRLANVLLGGGLTPRSGADDQIPWLCGQDTIGLLLLNGTEYIEATFGAYAARTVPFNINYRYVAKELAYLLSDAKPRALIFHGRFADPLADALEMVDEPPALLLQVTEDDDPCALLPGAIDYAEAVASASPVLEISGHSPDDVYLLYTGGTTGMPKGVIWRHNDIWRASLGGDGFGDVDLDEIGVKAREGRDRFQPNAPFMHGAAHWMALRSILGGGSVVINSVVEHLDPRDVWETAERTKVKSMLMVGEACVRPLLSELARSDYDTSTLKVVILGGAATTVESKTRLIAALPSARIMDAAGASETGTGLQAMSTGQAYAEARVFDASPSIAVVKMDRTGLVSKADDQVGWYARGGTVPRGYLGDEAKSRETFPTIGDTRWAIPGDLARWRSDGRLELLGRDSVTINTGGEKVFAEEVEAALLSHPAVEDAVVVGRPSARWGEEVVAILQMDRPVPDQDILEVAGTHIARYKLPKLLIRVDAVLRSPAGKADYRWAKSLAADHRG